MSGLFEGPAHATPLDPDERDGLIPGHVALRAELDELEQQNIVDADIWAFSRRRDPVSEPFGRGLHRRMFGRVWRWAGSYRTTDKNLGVQHPVIRLRLYEVFDNIRYWTEEETFDADEIAARFHHALVSVHPFANGNGRWSRLMADILLARLGRPRFSLGAAAVRTMGETRKAYIQALHAADRHDFGPLIAFLRS